MVRKIKQSSLFFIICYISYASVYVARLNLSAASSTLEQTGIMTKSQIGILGSIFFTVFSLGRFINGYLGDKIKPEYLIASGLSIIGLSNIFSGLFLGSNAVMLFWGINAFGQSMLWGAITKTVVYVYGTEKSKTMMPYIVTSTTAGSVLGLIIGTVSINYLNLQYVFYIPGVFAIIMGITVVLTVKTKSSCDKTKSYSMTDLLKDYRILSVFIPVMLHGAIKDNISLWCAAFFMDKFNLDISYAVFFAFAVPVTGFVGRIVYNALYKHMNQNEHKVAAFAFAVCGICCAFLSIRSMGIIISVILISLVSASINIVNTSYLSIFPIRFTENNAVSMSSGVLDLFTYIGSGVSSAFFGVMIQHYGYESMYLAWFAISVLSVVSLRYVIRKFARIQR